MARKNTGLTKTSIKRRRKEGRGRGEGSEYMPWMTVRDTPSNGQANRPLGWKTGRVHQFFSINELRYFYFLEWSPIVSDIREQFPLWPLEETQEIASDLGLKHPQPPGGGLVIMTSDFRITLRDGTDVVRTVKPAADLNNERVLQKFDLEREYWRRHDVDWGIIVAEDIPLTVAKNVEWLHTYRSSDGLILDPQDQPEVVLHLTEQVHANTEEALASITSRCDDQLALPPHTCLAVARHLLATQQWDIDIIVPINISRPLVLRDPKELECI